MILKKRIFSNVPFTIFVVVLYLAMIASPLSVRLSEIATPGFFSSIGQHPTFFGYLWIVWLGEIGFLQRELLFYLSFFQE